MGRKRKDAKKAAKASGGGGVAFLSPLGLLSVAGVAVVAYCVQRSLRVGGSASPYERAALADRALMEAVGAPVVGPSQFDRAIAWCSQHWDASTGRLAEATLERLERGRKRVIQRRFNVGVLEATPERKAPTLWVRPER